MMHKIDCQRGSAIAYMFLALFVAGLIALAMTRDTGINVSGQKMQNLKTTLKSEISVAQSAIQECVQSYPDWVDLDSDGDADLTDNPNPAYPVYNDLSTGTAGGLLVDIICPGSSQEIMEPATGRILRILDSALYDTNYFNYSDVDGDWVYVTISPVTGSAAWNEAVTQLQAEHNSCEVDLDTTTGTCATYYCPAFYIKRPDTC